MRNHRLSTVWVRVPGIIALVLAGIVAGAVLAGAAGVGGGAGPDKHPPVQRQNPQQHAPGGGQKSPGGGHG